MGSPGIDFRGSSFVNNINCLSHCPSSVYDVVNNDAFSSIYVSDESRRESRAVAIATIQGFRIVYESYPNIITPRKLLQCIAKSVSTEDLVLMCCDDSDFWHLF
mmetsp:Transcript_28335/g.68203  ORF Transcript_28335/g.68203 Transcript_28335/m.68203 type:complete len:104 (+) Transcript_28335:2170-2481(+)